MSMTAKTEYSSSTVSMVNRWSTPYFLSWADSWQKVKLTFVGTIEIWCPACCADLFLDHGDFGSSTHSDSKLAEPCQRQPDVDTTVTRA